MAIWTTRKGFKLRQGSFRKSTRKLNFASMAENTGKANLHFHAMPNFDPGGTKDSIDPDVLAKGGMNEIETFFGLIETTADALRVVELCRQGRLGRVSRRLHEKERQLIRSGSVFVFDEIESGIKRWTDGRIWSPSRILGNFLIYRELERKTAESKKTTDSTGEIQDIVEDLSSDPALVNQLSQLEDAELAGLLPWLSEPVLSDENGEEDQQLEVLKSKKLLTNHKGKYIFKPRGLIKKTISIKIDGHPHHLICYYSKHDFCQGHLGQSSFNQELMRELRKVRIPPELIAQQSFRKPTGLQPPMTLPTRPMIDFQAPPPAIGKRSERGKVLMPQPKRRSSFPGAIPVKPKASQASNNGSSHSNIGYLPLAPSVAEPLYEGYPMMADPSFCLAQLEMMMGGGEFGMEGPSSRDDTFYNEAPYFTSEPIISDGYPGGGSSTDKLSSAWTPEIESISSAMEPNGRRSPFDDAMMPCIRPPSALFDVYEED